ncbi:MAG: alanine--tRNA ligase-related protein [Candidatus Nanoarchaeia archaeon]
MKKLFWDDPYQTECKAKVVAIDGNHVKLDQTVFYAFSGGQASDEGTIGGIKIINAVKQGDKEDIIGIDYELETTPNFKVGDEVEVKIDEQRRTNLRNLHSATHIAYYIAEEMLGKLKIIGSNVSPNKGRIDLAIDEPLTEKIQELNKKLNRFLSEDHEIIMVPDDNKPDTKWWTCNSWKMPCGGTHVKSTKEIGRVKLKRKNMGAGKERIEITLP